MALSTADLPTLFTLLTNALSQDEDLRKPAEATLSACESRPGFCSCLLEIIAAKDLKTQTNARLLASVYFKNSINRYWRQRRDSLGISNEEKPHLRKKLLELIREENLQSVYWRPTQGDATHHCINRRKSMPELFSVLVQQLQAADILTTQRVYMVLYRTLKELSTKRLSVDQRNFAEVQVLNLLSVMIERLGEKVVPSAEKLLQFFPQLWEATLNHAPSMGPELLELFHYLIGVMEKSFDHLPVDNVSIVPRKAYALALCVLLTLREPQILDKLDQIISVCTNILVCDIDQNGSEESSYENLNSIENHEGGFSSSAGKRQAVYMLHNLSAKCISGKNCEFESLAFIFSLH